MTWQFFLLISILLASINGLIHRVVMSGKGSDSRAQTIVFLTLAGFFAFLVSLYHGFHFPNLLLLLPNFVLMVILLTLAPLFIFKAYQLSEASEVNILLSSQRLWTVIATFIFLGENPSAGRIGGTILILIGISVTTWHKHKIKLSRGQVFALIAAFLYGISYVNAFHILQHFDAPSLEVFADILPVLLLLLIQPQTMKKLKFYRKPKNLFNVTISALFDSLSAISLFIAYQIGRNASQLAPLSATPVIITIILAAIFLKERNNLGRKIFGAIIVIIVTMLII